MYTPVSGLCRRAETGRPLRRSIGLRLQDLMIAAWANKSPLCMMDHSFRPNTRWQLFIVLFYGAVFAITTMLESVVCASFQESDTLRLIRANPSFLSSLLVIMFLSGFVEETGWWGIALGTLVVVLAWGSRGSGG
jgi:RsiW-degrading membrane proteinase PrsW (M82 family)